VLVSALLNEHGAPAKAVRAGATGGFTPCASLKIWREYVEVLRRPDFPFSKHLVSIFLEDLRRQCFFVEGQAWPAALPDPDDAMFLEAAEAAGADCLVTGNLKHFPAAACGRIRVLGPAEFLKILP
jgi:predicted nucleic acid-binding protein